jgi:hypothetical protein
MKQGVYLTGCDWKYGWPHKFGVNGIINPHFTHGKEVRVGSKTVDGVLTPVLDRAPKFCHATWQNIHLEDKGYDRKALNNLLEALKDSGIEFLIDLDEDEKATSEVIDGESGIKFRAPYKGYQKTGLNNV